MVARPLPVDERLSALVGMGRALRAARRYSDVVELVAEEALGALGAASVSLSRWEVDRQHLRVIVNVGRLTEDEQRWPVDETYAVRVHPELYPRRQQGEASVFRVDDPDTPARERALLTHLDKATSLATPIRYDGGYWGELYATRDVSDPPFTDDDLVYAEAVADYVSVGLAHADHVAQVGRLAFEDGLTGLANRRALDARLDEAFEEVRDAGTVVSLLLVDVNGLKGVNDEHGHEAGDAVLVEVGRILSAVAADVPDSLPARLGGDEFCLLLVGPSADTAAELAEEVVRCGRLVSGVSGLSCGVASTGEPVLGRVESPAVLLRLADAAQYRAKREHSLEPVVAGRTALGVERDLEASEPAERRSRRGRLSPDVGRFLTGALAALDGVPDASDEERLRVLAAAAESSLDAAAWFVSKVPPQGDVLVAVAESTPRRGVSTDPTWSGSLVGTEWPLAEYPQSRDAVAGGWFAVELGGPGNDPAEEAVLVASGHTSMVAAGGTAAGGSAWLVEVFADALSLSVVGLGPALRGLVAAALAPRHGTGPGSTSASYAVPHQR
ncbi:MAG: diguanylate cyclase domain-containing protein [Actinomycetes bacterium]